MKARQTTCKDKSYKYMYVITGDRHSLSEWESEISEFNKTLKNELSLHKYLKFQC